ncbi:MAG TPA: hypothetical protein VM070_01040 [Candidatus Saccharimonadales bacterium]|nr:hypothetical protein [Candidatus Saccharimonadales bacterium]
MSLPPFRVYGVVGVALALVFGGAAWGFWRQVWISVAVGGVFGVAGLAVLIALSGSPKEPGLRAPDDPRA